MRPICESCKWFSIDMEDRKHGIRLSHCSNIAGELHHTWYKSVLECSEYEKMDEITDEVLDALIAEDQKNEMENNYRGLEE